MADIGDHTVKRFSTSGQLLTTIGTTGQAGNATSPYQFDHVADIAFAPDNDDGGGDENGFVFISDGDGGENNRVAAFAPVDPTDPTTSYQLMWHFGKFGLAPNNFNSPHSLTIDETRRLWVADRDNKRVSYFGQTPSGETVLGSWNCWLNPTIGGDAVAWGIASYHANSWLAMADGQSSQLLIVAAQFKARTCNVMWRGPVPTGAGGQVHLLDVDQSTGDVYVAVIGTAPNTYAFKYQYTPPPPPPPPSDQ